MADKETSWLIKLVDKLSGPLKTIEKVAKSATAGLDAVEKSAGKLQNTWSGAARIIAGAGLALSFATLTQESIAFEKGMALANTVMKATPEELTRISDQVRELSKEVPLMREQFTTGLNDIVQAGVPAENAMKFLADSSKAAVGGQADLSEVVKTTVSIVKAYGLEWDKATEIQNRMQKAVDIGMMSMGEFAAALPNVTVLSSQLGVGIDEMTGAFAAMTGVTGNASEVSTQLAAIMSGIISPTEQAAEMAERLGVSFNAASIRDAGGLANYLNVLMPKIDALSASTGMTKEGIIAALFGRKEAIIGVLGLTGQLSQAWSDATTEMQNSAGAVQFAFDTMSQTTDAKIQKMKNNLANLWDKLFVAAAPVISGIIEGLTKVFDTLAKFPEQHPYITSTVIVLGGLTLAVAAFDLVTKLATLSYAFFTGALYSTSIGKVIGFFTTLAFSLLGLQAPLGAATSSTLAFNTALYLNPIGLIVLAILALIAVVTIMIMKWEEWGAALSLLFGPIGMIISFVMSLKKNWDMVKEAFTSGGIIEGLKAIGKVLLDAVLYPVEQVLSLIADISGAEWAKKGMQSIQDYRKSLGLNTEKTQPAAEGEAQGSDSLVQKMAKELGIDLTPQKIEMPKTLTPAGGNSNSFEASGGSKGAAVVNFKNTFNLTVNGTSEDPRTLVDVIIARITDQLSDSAVMSTN
jgi:TP901 family phage tail tape measure protein